MKSLLTTHDAAKVIGVHPFTVAKWIDRGYIKAWRTAGGHRRVSAADLRAYLVGSGRPLPAALGADGGKLRILVIDDEQVALNSIARSFKPLAGEVELTLTTSPVDALLLLMDLKPDAVLIDINMPQLDGIEVCRRVRAYPSLASVALLTMTATHGADVAKEAIRAGAISCLAKPFNPGDVLNVIRENRALAPSIRNEKSRRLKAAEARP